MMGTPWRQSSRALLVALLLQAPGIVTAGTEPSSDLELREAIRLFSSGASLDSSLSAARKAERNLPKSHLAYFLQYQAYTAMAGGDPNSPAPAVQAVSPETHRELVNEERARGKLATVAAGTIPSAIVQIAPGTDTVLLVESERSRLWVLTRKGDSVEVVANHYVSVGQQGVGKEREGDRKTPLGLYRISNEIPGTKLIDFYGPFALPLDYPNLLDRSLAKTGSGIWLHGVPSDRYARPPRASDGCVVLANEDLLAIRKYAKPGRTSVVVVPQTNWLTPSQWRSLMSSQRAELPLENLQKVSGVETDQTRESIYHLESEQLIVTERIDRRGRVLRDYFKRNAGRWVPYLSDSKPLATN